MPWKKRMRVAERSSRVARSPGHAEKIIHSWIWIDTAFIIVGRAATRRRKKHLLLTSHLLSRVSSDGLVLHSINYRRSCPSKAHDSLRSDRWRKSGSGAKNGCTVYESSWKIGFHESPPSRRSGKVKVEEVARAADRENGCRSTGTRRCDESRIYPVKMWPLSLLRQRKRFLRCGMIAFRSVGVVFDTWLVGNVFRTRKIIQICRKT